MIIYCLLALLVNLKLIDSNSNVENFHVPLASGYRGDREFNMPSTDENNDDNYRNGNLMELFKTIEYRLNVNKSSTCNYTGNERFLKCHQVQVFDDEAYRNALKDLTKMIVNRIGLNLNTKSKNVSRNSVKLLSGIERNYGQSKKSIQHTEYDKHDMISKTVKLIYEANGKHFKIKILN